MNFDVVRYRGRSTIPRISGIEPSNRCLEEARNEDTQIAGEMRLELKVGNAADLFEDVIEALLPLDDLRVIHGLSSHQQKRPLQDEVDSVHFPRRPSRVGLIS